MTWWQGLLLVIIVAAFVVGGIRTYLALRDGDAWEESLKLGLSYAGAATLSPLFAGSFLFVALVVVMVTLPVALVATLSLSAILNLVKKK